MTDDKVKARFWEQVKSIVYEWSEDGESRTVFPPHELGSVVEYKDYLALQSELTDFKAEAKRAFELLECVGSDAVFRRIDAEKALIEVTKERDGLRSTLEFLRDNRMHDSRVTELCREALKEIK